MGKRIKDLTTATPTGDEFVAFDSDDGTKKATLTDAVQVGLDDVFDNPADYLGVGTPVGVGGTNAEGSSSLLARRDHVHKFDEGNLRAAAAELSAAIDMNEQRVTFVGDGVQPGDAVNVGQLEDAIAAVPTPTDITIVAPTSPGATAAVIANIVAGSKTFTNISSPTGEPGSYSAPYYLVLTDGVHTETVTVIARSGTQRTVAGPVAHTYAAGPSTVAYAGPACSAVNGQVTDDDLVVALADANVLGVLDGASAVVIGSGSGSTVAIGNASATVTMPGGLDVAGAITASSGTGVVLATRTVSAGNGISGGGTLAADLTFAADFGTGTNKVLQATSTAFLAVAATLAAALDVNAQKISNVGTPTANTDASTKLYVDCPAIRVVTGNSDTLATTDRGKAIAYTQAGAVAVSLPDLSGSFPSNSVAVMLLQTENAATALTITPSGGAKINNSTSPWAPTAGYGVWALSSRDGLNWFHS